MAKRVKVTKRTSESYEAGLKRKADERARRGFVYRSRPGRYSGDSGGASKMTQGFAREQQGRDRFKAGSFGENYRGKRKR